MASNNWWENYTGPTHLNYAGYNTKYNDQVRGAPSWGLPTKILVNAPGMDPFRAKIPHPENFGGDMSRRIGGDGLRLGDGNQATPMGQLMQAMQATGGSQTSPPATNTGTLPAPNPYGGTMNSGNVVPSQIGPMESLLQQHFQGSLGGGQGGPIANMLFSLGQGQLPQALTDSITATTNEQYGKMGARFGTDLGTAISRGLGQASAGMSLDAIDRILGLGGTATGFEFQRSESALDRALQEYLQQQQGAFSMDNSLLMALMGGGGF